MVQIPANYKRSSAENRMAKHADEYPNPPLADETPKERAERLHRNFQELKKSRAIELRQGNQKAVTVLDAELESGRGTDFPEDASLDDGLGFVADDDLGFVADTPRAGQGDVRKTERPELGGASMAMIEQEADERGWDAAGRKFDASGTPLKPGQTRSQAISAASGLSDPADTRSAAEAQHTADTGEALYGDSVAYNAAKAAAAMGGFAVGGPLGATLAEALPRAIALGANLNAALDKGMDPVQAADVFVNEMTKGIGLDALFNVGVPLIGHLIAITPGLKRIGPAIHAAIERRIGMVKPKPNLHDAKLDTLKGLAADPNRKAAIDELAAKSPEDFIPTPGQARGKVGVWEQAESKAYPAVFKEQEGALRAGADQMLAERTKPLSQMPGQPAIHPDAKIIGERIEELTDKTIKATKDRLRPIFRLANEQGVHSDFSKVSAVAHRALQRPDKLTPTEHAHLQSIVDDAIKNPLKDAEHALDFASVQKAMARTLNQNGESTPYYKIILDDMIRESDAAFTRAMDGAGKGRIKMLLDSARSDYRKMNKMAYDGALKQVLKKGDNSPEDVAKFLWQSGKVTRVEQLDEMLGMARREGVAGSATTSKLRRDVTRAFLQKAVQDVDSAANWSKMLRDPDRAATWAVLSKGPDGQALKNGMAVLEQAAQMATLRDTGKQSPFLGGILWRATSGTLGLSLVTGAVNPLLVGAGMTIDGIMRLMATAYVRGDIGTINLMTKVLRANSTTTAASAKALQAMIPQLEKAADKYKVTDLFMKKDEEGEEAPAPQQPEQSTKSTVDTTVRPNPKPARPIPPTGGVRG